MAAARQGGVLHSARRQADGCAGDPSPDGLSADVGPPLLSAQAFPSARLCRLALRPTPSNECRRADQPTDHPCPPLEAAWFTCDVNLYEGCEYDALR
jgi:hypothetical protein